MDEPQRCQAMLDAARRCPAKRSGSHATCKPCATRIVTGMHRIMDSYGMHTRALRKHWRLHDIGATCPTCFEAAHARMYARIQNGAKDLTLPKPCFIV